MTLESVWSTLGEKALLRLAEEAKAVGSVEGESAPPRGLVAQGGGGAFRLEWVVLQKAAGAMSVRVIAAQLPEQHTVAFGSQVQFSDPVGKHSTFTGSLPPAHMLRNINLQGQIGGSLKFPEKALN